MTRATSTSPGQAVPLRRHRLRAIAAWLAVLAGMTMALELVVLAIAIGPFGIGLGVVIAGSTIVSIGGGVAFWRLVGHDGGRPGLAATLLLVATAWASLAALTIAWLFTAFNP